MAAHAGSDLTQAPGTAAGELGSLLGVRLLERRRELGRTLGQVGRAAGVSASYLSSIENAASVPSLPVLARLAHALELSLAEMLRSSASARVTRGRIGSAVGAQRIGADDSRLQIMRRCARPGERGRAPVRLGDTDVFVFLHSGRLEVVVDGTPFALEAGDSLHCDLPAKVSWTVTGEERAIALWAARTAEGRA